MGCFGLSGREALGAPLEESEESVAEMGAWDACTSEDALSEIPETESEAWAWLEELESAKMAVESVEAKTAPAKNTEASIKMRKSRNF